MADQKPQVVPQPTSAMQALRVRQIQTTAAGIVPTLNDVVNNVLTELAKNKIPLFQEGVIVALTSVLCGRCKAGGIPLENLLREVQAIYASTEFSPVPPPQDVS